jgi:hypothetical protein
MPRADLDSRFREIDDLLEQIDKLVPESGSIPYLPKAAHLEFDVLSFRSDLAGLLVVKIAATYETCVKQVLQEYAASRHVDFGTFARNQYDRINSKIRVKDLKNYCGVFGTPIENRFKASLSARKSKILKRARKNIETSYEQILDWRHDFAHQWNRVATIREVVETHKAGKRILYVFDDAFNIHQVTE